jgi:hypothetical protein
VPALSTRFRGDPIDHSLAMLGLRARRAVQVTWKPALRYSQIWAERFFYELSLEGPG